MRVWRCPSVELGRPTSAGSASLTMQQARLSPGSGSGSKRSSRGTTSPCNLLRTVFSQRLPRVVAAPWLPRIWCQMQPTSSVPERSRSRGQGHRKEVLQCLLPTDSAQMTTALTGTATALLWTAASPGRGPVAMTVAARTASRAATRAVLQIGVAAHSTKGLEPAMVMVPTVGRIAMMVVPPFRAAAPGRQCGAQAMEAS
mmetsp:Transcript_7581/g.19447  ORF Transcript_7581/g.19447 Transcript_7581/m.19447 type:complete len:200 (-) Transcript_7581:1526-2125(-)